MNSQLLWTLSEGWSALLGAFIAALCILPQHCNVSKVSNFELVSLRVRCDAPHPLAAYVCVTMIARVRGVSRASKSAGLGLYLAGRTDDRRLRNSIDRTT